MSIYPDRVRRIISEKIVVVFDCRNTRRANPGVNPEAPY